MKLAVNPVMLTALASLHWNGKRLPAQRSELVRFHSELAGGSAQEQSGRPERVLLLRMRRIALAMHADERGKQVEYTRDEAADCIEDEFEGKTQAIRRDKAVEFLQEEETYSGILIGIGNRSVLAPDISGGARRHRTGGRRRCQERSTFRCRKTLSAGLARNHIVDVRSTVQSGTEAYGGLSEGVLKPLNAQSPLAECARAAALLGAILRDLEAWNYEFKDPKYGENLRRCLGIFDAAEASAIPFETRLEAAEAIGKAGDPRLGENNWVRVSVRFHAF